MADTEHEPPGKESFSWGGGTPADAPEYVFHRIKAWDAAAEARKSKQSQQMDTSDSSQEIHIKVTLPDGTVKDGIKNKTSPMDIAMAISENLAKKALVALVNGKEWDMERPLEADCSLKICDFESLEGKMVLWHSTAHMLGEAMEYKYKGELCIGPPLEEGGFYYDMHTHGLTVTDADFKDLENRVDKIAKSKRTFQRMELTKDEARAMFSYNKFKMELIEKLEEGTTITAYRDGPFIDLCRGPHVPHSHRIKAMTVTKIGQAYWLGKPENPSLQRVYGISFPDPKLLKEYKMFLEEAAKRDHRLIGKNQELFMFHPLSPGSAFFLPHGMRIYNALVQFLRDEYWKRGYLEVNSPNVYDFALWETSGHAQNYRENMFSFTVENREFGLKPMNCPGHCLIFGSKNRSYRELPIRMADFGVLHRNEASGALTGLTRVRRFQQDDAHIFCMPEQVSQEVLGYLDFLKYVYGIFGFTFELDLSTRPEKYMGELSLWNKAEAELGEALEQFTGKKCGEKGGWQINAGDGAFYGPKIDIKIFDALKRRHQCATVQLDFQLPIRFDLWYKTSGPAGEEEEGEEGDDEKPKEKKEKKKEPKEKKEKKDNKEDAAAEAAVTAAPASAGGEAGVESGKPGDMRRPVIIHRAVFGSVERFFAILCEHFAGKWPFWLSPRQVIVLPVVPKFFEYAETVRKRVHEARFFVDVDTSKRKLTKMIREAQLAQYNLILVVGEEEMSHGTVNVRTRDNEVHGELSIDDFIKKCQELKANFQ